MQITYELHALIKDRWNIERTYKSHQKDEALEDAKQLNRESHVTAVKLICETYNEQANTFSEVVVFDTTRPTREPAIKPRPAAPQTAQPTAATTANVAGQRQPRSKKKPPSMAGTMVLVVIMILAVAVLVVVLGRGKDLLGGL